MLHSVVHAGLVFLETIFIVGWIGAIVVVVISGVEDMKTVFSKDESEHHAPIEG